MAETDEFVAATVVGDGGRVQDGDAVFFFNFRTDRGRQLTEAFVMPEFDGFDRGTILDLHFATMTRYRADFPVSAAYQPQRLDGIMPDLVSDAGLRQLRIAETEKYAHVTFFLSGGNEQELAGESRILVPSPRVATYDEQPAMSAVELTDKYLAALENPETRPHMTWLNFANADMVGHTGMIPAAVAAVKTLDQCMARIVPRIVELGGVVAITADHGNAEQMRDPVTGEPHTAHTTNAVPLLFCGEPVRGRTVADGGRLCDLAPSLLPLLGIPKGAGNERRRLAELTLRDVARVAWRDSLIELTGLRVCRCRVADDAVHTGMSVRCQAPYRHTRTDFPVVVVASSLRSDRCDL